MTRREWIAMISAAPLLQAAETAAPAAPVSIAKCASYDEDLTAKLAAMFDQLGGIEKLVRNKTVTVKVNMTGSPGQRVQGKRAGDHALHAPETAGRRRAPDGQGRREAHPLRRELLGHRRVRWKRRCSIPAGTCAACNRPPPVVEFENTNALGKGKKYARFKVPGAPYMYPAYDLNHAYEDTDVYVSMAKLKNHETCGITLSLQELLRHDSGVDLRRRRGRGRAQREAHQGPLKVGHEGVRQPAKSAPQELHFGANHDPGYRVPHIVADLVAARPIHLAIIDGVETIAGGEGPWIRGVRRCSRAC